MKTTFGIILAAAALGAATAPVRLLALSEAEAASGRALSRRFGDAIVGVQLIAEIKISVGDRAMPLRLVRLEANGTVISPAGLTATSLTEIDPRRTAEAMTRNLTLSGGQRIKIGGTEYKQVNLLLCDGTIIPAKVVLKDADLDLALIAPIADTVSVKKVFTWVKLEDSAAPVILQDYFVVSRAPQSLQRVAEVHLSTIEGVVERPRLLFIPNGYVTGCPMLDPQGRVLGLCLAQIADGNPVMAGGRASGVVIPAAEIARQAKPLLSMGAGVDQKTLFGDHLAVVGGQK
jgi:hypothetical protein